MTKTHLRALFFALHEQLEREVTHVPKTVVELRKACSKMQKRLRECPDGVESVKRAHEAANSEDYRLWIDRLQPDIEKILKD